MTTESQVEFARVKAIAETAELLTNFSHEKLTVGVKVERHSKGTNWEASVSGAGSVEEAMALLDKATGQLQLKYGNVSVVA
jgi:hypothetical protein